MIIHHIYNNSISAITSRFIKTSADKGIIEQKFFYLMCQKVEFTSKFQSLSEESMRVALKPSTKASIPFKSNCPEGSCFSPTLLLIKKS